jgi:hypothetical protein
MGEGDAHEHASPVLYRIVITVAGRLEALNSGLIGPPNRGAYGEPQGRSLRDSHQRVTGGEEFFYNSHVLKIYLRHKMRHHTSLLF